MDFIRAALLLALTVAPTASLASAAVSSAQADPALRQAVVRVEAALDPTSVGPELAAELAARQPWTPFEAELARRLRVGATGSGFLVNAQGDVVTNAHVVLSGVRFRRLRLTYAAWDSMTRLLRVIRDLWVTVGDGDAARTYLAVPVLVAEDLDLAVLRVSRPPGDDTTFAALPIGNSDSLRVGDSIVALGFPEEEFQATSGEILSLIRGARVHEDLQYVRRVHPDTGREIITLSGTRPGPVGRLQHSARTGHGSSGGPIVDGRGAVVGVAYALLSDGGAEFAEGLQSSEWNLGIASNVLKLFLRKNAIAYTEAGK
jgi:S1-C subfamily serine protease